MTHPDELARQLAAQETRLRALVAAAAAREARDFEHVSELAALTRTLQELETRLAAGTAELADRASRIDALTRTVGASQSRVSELARDLALQEEQVESLIQAAEEREAQLTALTDDVAALADDIAARDERIAALDQAVKQRDAAIQHLGVTAVQIHQRLRELRASLGWRLFWPLRMLRSLVARLGGKIRIVLSPLNQLQAAGGEWAASGNDPQFLVMADRGWSALTGWHWLEFDLESAQALNARIYFDLGEGFEASRAIRFRLSGSGGQRIPLYVPSNCHAIRLDPCDAPARFRIPALRLVHAKGALELPSEFADQASIYEALGGQQGNAADLDPHNAVSRLDEDGYLWRSNGADPSFEVKDLCRELRAGWYLVELRLRLDIGRGNAKFYFDFGKGYGEKGSVGLPFGSGQTIERLCHLEAVPRRVRFDPIECVGRFSVERLHFSPVAMADAPNVMLQRLGARLAQYKDLALEQIWADVEAQAAAMGGAPVELLYMLYCETFPTYGADVTSADYAEWIEQFEVPEFSDAAALEAKQKRFRHKPLISVIVPAYNTPETYLRRAIESVQAQSYPRWELCIADDASPESHVRAVLEEYARGDARIKVTFRGENGHISAASNSALALAKGEYVALLDHDDELALHALHVVVEAINRNPAARILYSDEDKIDGHGNRSAPHFKPDWNPELFFSQNYVSHLGVYRRDLLKRIGGFRAGVEGSQDQDLLLRCLPHVKPAAIVHIPKVLYHWRMLEGSTALESEGKDYTLRAGIKALEDYFGGQGRSDVTVEPGLAPNTYRVRFPVPRPEPLASLLIPTRDKVELLEPCVRSILEKTTYPNYEIVIIDNGSVESATLDYFKRIQREDGRVRVVPYPYPFNFSAINNFGVREARGALIGLVNNDIEVISPDWLTEMASHALRPEIGCVGAKLYYDDETIQHAGVIVGLGGVAGHSHKYFPREASGYFHRLKIVQNLSAVTGACLLIRRQVYEEVGGLEETGLGVAFNDVDFCLKVRAAGYRNLWTPYAELYHHESKSRGHEDTPDKVKRFNREADFMRAKWGEILRRDPCYSPNLTLAREDFSLR